MHGLLNAVHKSVSSYYNSMFQKCAMGRINEDTTDGEVISTMFSNMDTGYPKLYKFG